MKCKEELRLKLCPYCKVLFVLQHGSKLSFVLILSYPSENFFLVPHPFQSFSHLLGNSAWWAGVGVGLGCG